MPPPGCPWAERWVQTQTILLRLLSQAVEGDLTSVGYGLPWKEKGVET